MRATLAWIDAHYIAVLVGYSLAVLCYFAALIFRPRRCKPKGEGPLVEHRANQYPPPYRTGEYPYWNQRRN